MTFEDFFWLYMVHALGWYFFFVIYKMIYSFTMNHERPGHSFLLGLIMACLSLLFHYALHRVGYAPLIIK